MEKGTNFIDFNEKEKLFVSDENLKVISYIQIEENTCKTLDFICSEDLMISASYIDVDEKKEDKTYVVSMNIEEENPLYEDFCSLLGDEDEMLLDDDASEGTYYRYVKFTKRNNQINMTFSCTVTNVIPAERFWVFLRTPSKTSDEKKKKISSFMDQVISKYKNYETGKQK